jgi:hypothetical protein
MVSLIKQVIETSKGGWTLRDLASLLSAWFKSRHILGVTPYLGARAFFSRARAIETR